MRNLCTDLLKRSQVHSFDLLALSCFAYFFQKTILISYKVIRAYVGALKVWDLCSAEHVRTILNLALESFQAYNNDHTKIETGS